MQLTITNENDIHDEIKNNLIRGMISIIIHSKTFFLPVLYKKNLKSKIYKTVILPVVLYGCETWSLTLEEEYRLRVLQKGVLRRIFGSKREVDLSWKNLHNDELHTLYPSPKLKD
jgi:hypothetical protein